MAGTVLPITYPVLDIDLSTQQDRQECYDTFSHYCLKVEQYLKFSGSCAYLFFGTNSEKIRRRMLIINSTTATYKVLREVFLGPNWMASTDFVSANNRLNQILNGVPIQELYDKLGMYLKEKQQKALTEPPSYETKVRL